MDDFKTHVTPFAAYRELFKSRAFGPVEAFVWRYPVCSPEEIAETRRLLKNRQVMVARWSAEWLR